ncbi:MAG: hypothetical protein M0012_02625 [Deltaproteobacteria bacterium]|nr:hypothetical protein [Deltaproteobacteria bacterium]
MKKINFRLKGNLHDRYTELKKIDDGITINELVRKGLNQTIERIQDEIRKKPFDHKNDHSLKK